jgi:hypothetical protein
LNVEFSTSEVMALRNIVADYILRPNRTEVFVDVLRGTETTPEELLGRLVDAGGRGVQGITRVTPVLDVSQVRLDPAYVYVAFDNSVAFARIGFQQPRDLVRWLRENAPELPDGLRVL